MPLPFDAMLKDIVQHHLHDFTTALRLGGPQPAVVLNVDLSTISAATDIALGYGEPPQLIDDLNFQSGFDPDLAARVLLYNALLHYRYRVPVHSVVVLLRPAADDPHLDGKLRYEARRRRGKMAFGFEVVRLWREPVRRVLEGGLGTLPLAPLCRLPEGISVEEALPGVIRDMERRLLSEARPEERTKLLTAAYVLCGLRLPKAGVERVFRGIQIMRESSTYQGILEEGRVEGRLDGVRSTLLQVGRIKLGRPTKATTAALESITDLRRLQRMSERLLSASSWQELLL